MERDHRGVCGGAGAFSRQTVGTTCRGSASTTPLDPSSSLPGAQIQRSARPSPRSIRCAHRTRQVAGAKASHQNRGDARLHARGFLRQIETVAQHQGDRENCAQRIGDALARNVGRRSVNRFVEADRTSDAGRGQQAQRSYDSARLIRQNIAEHIFGEDDVELGGLEYERHGRRIHVHVRELNIGKIAADASHNFAPETRALQNIRLVDGKHAPPAAARKLKGDAGDALDLWLAVAHGIDRLARAFTLTFNRPRLRRNTIRRAVRAR